MGDDVLKRYDHAVREMREVLVEYDDLRNHLGTFATLMGGLDYEGRKALSEAVGQEMMLHLLRLEDIYG